MATPRTQHGSQRRVKEIAEEAASKIAAESPTEEEVIVTVEELPPGDTSPTPRGHLELFDAYVATATLGQRVVADAVSSWIDMAKPFVPSAGGSSPWLAFDPRSAVEVGFKFAEDVLAMQKETLLTLVGAGTPAAARATAAATPV
jgi:hypothetical protein